MPKISYGITIAAICVLYTAASWAEEESAHMQKIADALQKQFSGLKIDASVKAAGNTVVIEKALREYKIYKKTASGEWETTLTTIVGPSHEGFRMVVKTTEAAIVARSDKPSLNWETATREPYFNVSYSKIVLDSAQPLLVDISFGLGAQEATLSKIYAEVEKALRQEFQTTAPKQ